MAGCVGAVVVAGLWTEVGLGCSTRLGLSTSLEDDAVLLVADDEAELASATAATSAFSSSWPMSSRVDSHSPGRIFRLSK